MSLKVVEDLCIGCGGCEYACPAGALTKTDSFLGLFEIDPFLCNDCGECVPKCPVFAIVADPEWPVCRGHGCPLTSERLAGVECAEWQQRCRGMRDDTLAAGRRLVVSQVRHGDQGPLPAHPIPRAGREGRGITPSRRG